jgi:hypothetical protein
MFFFADTLVLIYLTYRSADVRMLADLPASKLGDHLILILFQQCGVVLLPTQLQLVERLRRAWIRGCFSALLRYFRSLAFYGRNA